MEGHPSCGARAQSYASLPSSHITREKFKPAKRPYDKVEVLLLNWEANNLGLHASGRGSAVYDETAELAKVFEERWGFDVTHHEIPSVVPERQLTTTLAKFDQRLTKGKVVEKKKVLFILYYNGHGDVLDGKLVWSA